MFTRFLAVILASTVVTAQRGGGGLTGAQETALPAIGQQQTIAEQFVSQLRIDIKSQGSAVDEILIGATKQGAPIAQELLEVRQRMVNAALRNQPDEMKSLLDAYSAAATKMAALEGQAFMKVYGLLKPNQQQRAPEAFMIMAGIFLPAPPPARRPQQGGGR